MLRFLTLLKYNSPTYRFCSYTCDIHYYFTRNIFVACFILSITKQLFGETIMCCCMTRYPSDLTNSLCLLNNTFHYLNNSKMESDKYYHYYYQWVPLVFLLESLAFSAPNWLWEILVGNYIKQLSIQNVKLDEKYCDFIISELSYSKFFFNLKHLILDLIYCFNVLLQMYLLNIFLNNDFINLFKLPSNNLFQMSTLCSIKWHESSDYSVYKLRCILPLNVLYSKIFIVLWFWLHVICIFQILVVIHRLIKFRTKKFLKDIVLQNINGENRTYVTSSLYLQNK